MPALCGLRSCVLAAVNSHNQQTRASSQKRLVHPRAPVSRTSIVALRSRRFGFSSGEQRPDHQYPGFALSEVRKAGGKQRVVKCSKSKWVTMAAHHGWCMKGGRKVMMDPVHTGLIRKHLDGCRGAASGVARGADACGGGRPLVETTSMVYRHSSVSDDLKPT